MEYSDIGENIRKYRNRLDLTQEELADRIGVTWEMVSRYERGESSPMNKLEKISNALNVPITDLINDSLNNHYEVPLFMKIPNNFLFTKENTTLFYSCPKWLVKRDPQVFAINTNLVQSNDLISKEKGYIFISPNSEVYSNDLVLTKSKGRLSIKRLKQQNSPAIGKIMMQEIIFS